MTDERVTATVGGHKKNLICLLQATFKLIGEHKLENKLEILGFAGSLRAGSYDKALLLAAVELLPDGAALEIFDFLAFLPLMRILRE
jgi:hypothetical protein